MFFDILSGEVVAPDVKYRFAFLDSATAKFPWVKFKDLVFTTRKNSDVSEELKANAGRDLTPVEIDKLTDHLDLIDRTFKMDEAVAYQELDSIDNPTLYTDVAPPLDERWL